MKIIIDKRSSYNETHAIMLLRSLAKKSMSRTSLSKELGLGETTIRTMFKNLRAAHLTGPSTKGETLSKKGRTLIEAINNHISSPVCLDIKQLTLHDNNIGYRIRGAKIHTASATDMRDSAIKMGAGGQIILKQEEKLKIIDLAENNIEIPKAISETLNPEKGDYIIITFAESKKAAEIAGLGTAIIMIGFRLDA